MSESMRDTSMDFSDHSVWQLLLTVGMRELHAAFYDRNSGRFADYSRRRWECESADTLKCIEDAVYEDPLLLDDYDVSILIRPAMTLTVAPEDYPEEDSQKMHDALSLADATERKDVWREPLGEALALYSTPEGVRDFLSRTFLTERVSHALRPIVDYFTLRARTEGGERMWVHLEPGRLDVVAFRNGRLLLANTWSFATAADAAYYLLYAWRALGLDAAQGEMSVSGDKALRDEAVPMLRRYINYVRLTMYPASLAAPLREGISLCEALYMKQDIK